MAHATAGMNPGNITWRQMCQAQEDKYYTKPLNELRRIGGSMETGSGKVVGREEGGELVFNGHRASVEENGDG